MCGALAFVSPAQAAVCSVSPQSVSFGLYDSLDPSALDGVGNINVSCDAATSFTISLSAGSGSFSERTMSGGPKILVYNLYSDPARLIVWGDGNGATSTVSANSAGEDFTVYGQIPALQNLPAGAYADDIVVTVVY